MPYVEKKRIEEIEEKANRIIKRVLERTKGKLDDVEVVDEIIREAIGEMEVEIKKFLEDVWKRAIEDVKREVGVGLNFQRIDREHLRKIIESEFYKEVFAKYGEYAHEQIGRVIYEMMREPGYDIMKVRDELMRVIGVVKSRGENIARTEAGNIYRESKMLQLQKLEEAGEEFLYEWIGPDDRRTTEVCKRIKERTRGGVNREELVKIIREESNRWDSRFWREDRPFTPHYQCRHTFRVVRKRR